MFLGLLVRGPLSAWTDHEIDNPARSFSEAHNNETAVSLSRRLDDLGEACVTGAIAIVAEAVLWGRRRTSRPALLLASSFVGAVFVTVVVKRAVSRQPASGPIPRFSPGTFPSGHTLFALTVYGCLAVLVLRSGAPAFVRWATASVLLGTSVAIGLRTRVPPRSFPERRPRQHPPRHRLGARRRGADRRPRAAGPRRPDVG